MLAYIKLQATAAGKCLREAPSLRERCGGDIGALRKAVMDELQLHAGYAAERRPARFPGGRRAGVSLGR